VEPQSKRGSDPLLGRTLAARFTLVKKLGAGSMGAVYHAKQLATGRDVAIKILRDERALEGAAKARFLREARAHSLLSSPHTVRVLDFGQSDDGALFLVMELLEGESLGRRIRRLGRLPLSTAVDASRQVLRSLTEAHEKGVVHRDLKPDTVFFASVAGVKEEEVVKVLDFGVAKVIGDQGRHLNAVETREGNVFGTPRYMSPEQAQGKALDARSDLYAVGVLLYEMLTGRPPFTGSDAILVMAQHIKEPPKKPSGICPEAQIPLDLEELIMRALAKDPAERPESAEAFGEALGRLAASGLVDTTGVRSVKAPALDSGTLPTSEVEQATAPFPARRTRRRIGVLLGIAIAVGLFANVVVLSVRRAPRAGAPEGTLPSPVPSSAPAASAVTWAPAAVASGDIPTVRAEALPVAGSRNVPAPPAPLVPARRTPRAPATPTPRTPRTQAPPAATPSSGSNYQYLE
jgi:serine/threonine-protein kinase